MIRRPVLALLVSSITSGFLYSGAAFKILRAPLPLRLGMMTEANMGRRRHLSSSMGQADGGETGAAVPSKARRRRTKGDTEDVEGGAKAAGTDAGAGQVAGRRLKRTRAAAATEPVLQVAVAPEGEAAAAPVKAKKVRAPVVRAVIPRGQTLPPPSEAPLPPGRKEIKIVSWNVAGLRGVLKRPDAVAATVEWLARERPHVLCLQETKLQECHVEEVAGVLKGLLPDYQTTYWSCSTAKKGYSGLAILVSNDAAASVQGVRHGIGQPEGDAEGRVLTLDLGSLFVTAVYTPNAGEGLKRLDYRTKVWDPAFWDHVSKLGEGGKPVVVCGDLNVAHQDVDFFNPEEPRMKKAAGTTPEERESFGRLLQATGLVDTFRWRHGDVAGVYTYWSVRAGNRPFNRGLRLDYTLCSESLVQVEEDGSFPRLLDSFVFDEEAGLHGVSDHCPVGVLLGI